MDSETPDNPRSVNPYAAAPILGAVQLTAQTQYTGGIYNAGEFLLIHKQAVMPGHCICTNEPTDHRWHRKFAWHHPAVFALLFLGVIGLVLYIVVSISFRKTAEFDVPIKPERRATWRLRVVAAWILGLVGVVIGFIGIANSGTDSGSGIPLGVFIGFAGLVVLAVGLIVGASARRILSVHKIEGEWVWLRGPCPEFKAMFPPWPS